MGLSQACAGIVLKPGRAPEGSIVMETDLCACCGLVAP